MQKKDSWLLPEGIEEVLPENARYLEQLRRKLLDVFTCWGYELVIPPMVDFLDSLLTGSGHDLELQTFKLTDQVSGKLLGVRADMTPQVARIAVHQLQHDWPTRLCYAGTILHTLSDNLEKSRSPMQIGAELYGHQGLESDLEVIRLMLEMLAMSGIQNVHLDLGHVGIFRGLSRQAGLNKEQEGALFDVLQRKAIPELNELLAEYDLNGDVKQLFMAMAKLNGGREVFDKAADLFKNSDVAISQALQDLRKIAEQLAVQFPELPVHFDLSELRGYHYHTGIVFAAFIPGVGKEIARGGRYDNIGRFFGRARAATGFSADLKTLAALSMETNETSTREIVFAPYMEEADLSEKIRDLRAQGKIVIQQLPGQAGSASDLGCTAMLEKQNQSWVVKPLV
ncbi:ATP phosphoribosyltransferase regulatory subunit [Methylomarinum vadi]|uniref:ATP phosphoribosyltransferase regulatory subunit n=1 Tax=Methylomarinum vadi TaxID=438855 RepID=UPI0004DFB08D|nr:ATP phosphoribosyltransferase regulatory subunit [Methylomarinum vadi]